MAPNKGWVGGAALQVVDEEGTNIGGRGEVAKRIREKKGRRWSQQARDKTPSGDIEGAMRVWEDQENEFEVRVRNGVLPTKTRMYCIMRNKVKEKEPGYQNTKCPRCGEKGENQLHVFVQCSWNREGIGMLKEEGGRPEVKWDTREYSQRS